MEPARPLKVSELVLRAEQFTFNHTIPLKYWIRTAHFLRLEADNAIRDGVVAQAYIMLYRYATLIFNLLPKHPEYKTNPEMHRECEKLRKQVGTAVEELESLKPEITRRYNEWERMRPAGKVDDGDSKGSTYTDFASIDPALSGNAKILDATEHKDLAVDLANREITRRDTARRATMQAGIAPDDVDARRRAGKWDSGHGPPRNQDSDLRAQMEAARWQLDSRGGYQDDGYTSSHGREEPAPVVSQHYSYPSINKSRPVDYDRSTSQSSIASQPPPGQPSRPPKEPLRHGGHDDGYSSSRDSRQPPELPKKEALLSDYKPLIPSTDSQPPALPSRPPKTSLEAPPLPAKAEVKSEKRTTFKPGGYLENGEPMRSVFVPRGLMAEFLEVAAPKTSKGLETCGILLGSVVNNAWFIRCLLIPDQRATSDTCEMINEEKVIDYCEKEGDLWQVGWIHTHPTQTCFMSSRDLHTHASFQVLTPESIAIVCAPKYREYGIFRLTHPPGLRHVLECERQETFHPHSISNLEVSASGKNGHVIETDKLPFTVHDLRAD